ncbi:MAG: thiamine phosphate synthase [Catonella sp.]|uniref:thiamine phosphate synthase n=1 Tax=Catonella sp. TaxID=2382125 RepID=UPI003FA00147
MRISKDIFKLYGIIGGYETGDVNEYIISSCNKARDAFIGGVTMLQLREKHLPEVYRINLAKAIKEVCESYKIPLIINDSIDLCILSGADGVHLGQDDGSISDARKILGPHKIIGATAHNLSEAVQAEEDGANYLGSGAAFGSISKINASKIKLDEYNEITKTVKIPVIAIGGITIDNIDLLANRGLAGIACISGIFEGEDVKYNAGMLKEKLRHW